MYTVFFRGIGNRTVNLEKEFVRSAGTFLGTKKCVRYVLRLVGIYFFGVAILCVCVKKRTKETRFVVVLNGSLRHSKIE